MQQVPADRVIAELATRVGELSRENAILKVQVQLFTEQSVEVPPATNPAPDLSV